MSPKEEARQGDSEERHGGFYCGKFRILLVFGINW